MNASDDFARFRIVRLRVENAQIVVNGGQRIADLVRHARGDPADIRQTVLPNDFRFRAPQTLRRLNQPVPLLPYLVVLVAQRDVHVRQRPREPSDFVLRAHRHPVVQIALRHPRHRPRQLVQRPDDQREQRERTDEDGDDRRRDHVHEEHTPRRAERRRRLAQRHGDGRRPGDLIAEKQRTGDMDQILRVRPAALPRRLVSLHHVEAVERVLNGAVPMAPADEIVAPVRDDLPRGSTM
ncbi:MAG: hypothetical protein M5R36_12560 [Deltaproteobacteria bacterium]|nr:hypothetical protein [Deltaproteobacteria bacterium]